MKKCLIVVDYQKDFVDGALGFPEAAALDEKIAAAIDECRKNGGDIIFTLDTHRDNYLETREGRLLPVKHCIKNTEGHKLYGKTGEMKREGDRVFEKSTFGSDGLYEYLKANPYDEIELAGLVSNICVVSNAVLVRTALPEAEVAVRRELVGSGSREMNEAAMKIMESIQIKIV